MKHIIFIAIMLFLIYSIGSAYSYAMRCPYCEESIQKSKQNIGERGIAHRCFEIPVVHKDGHSYAVYKCDHGHRFLVLLK